MLPVPPPRRTASNFSYIAKRETLLSEGEKEAAACNRRFLSETRTNVQEGDVISLLRVLDQVLLAQWF